MGERELIDTSTKQKQKDLADEERREALKRLGKYAAYTAPAMLALVLPNKILADCRTPPCP